MFWEDLFFAVDDVFNILASKSRVEEGIKLLETLKEQRPVQYMADYQYYDYYLLHYYAPHGEKERMNEIKERRGGFYFSYSKESLDAYLGSYFGFLSLNDAKGMAGLKAHEFFSSFMHLKGIIRDKELRKIERVIEELNVPLRKFYERNRWTYRFLEAWR